VPSCLAHSSEGHTVLRPSPDCMCSILHAHHTTRKRLQRLWLPAATAAGLFAAQGFLTVRGAVYMYISEWSAISRGLQSLFNQNNSIGGLMQRQGWHAIPGGGQTGKAAA
jgi:hypothetical protein